MIYRLRVYLRNGLQLTGMLMLAVGLVLAIVHAWVLGTTGAAPAWSLDGVVYIPRWLRQASPLLQEICGWPFVLLGSVPLPLLLFAGGFLVLRMEWPYHRDAME
jgi:hypothetical protein